VAQIPALLISVAAAMVVSRVGKEQTSAARSAAGVRQLAALAGPGRRHRRPAGPGPGHAAPGVPADRRALGWLAWLAEANAKRPPKAAAAAAPSAAAANAEATWDDLQPGRHPGPGGGLPPDRAGGQDAPGRPAGRIKGVRKKFAQDVGFLPPPVHIRDNLELKPSAYRVTLRGAVVGEGEAFPGMLLAINPGGATQQLPGTRTTDPAFGLPAVWIDERQRSWPK
jgi:flagellar biosynthesis protein FlhA